MLEELAWLGASAGNFIFFQAKKNKHKDGNHFFYQPYTNFNDILDTFSIPLCSGFIFTGLTFFPALLLKIATAYFIITAIMLGVAIYTRDEPMKENCSNHFMASMLAVVAANSLTSLISSIAFVVMLLTSPAILTRAMASFAEKGNESPELTQGASNDTETFSKTFSSRMNLS